MSFRTKTVENFSKITERLRNNQNDETAKKELQEILADEEKVSIYIEELLNYNNNPLQKNLASLFIWEIRDYELLDDIIHAMEKRRYNEHTYSLIIWLVGEMADSRYIPFIERSFTNFKSLTYRLKVIEALEKIPHYQSFSILNKISKTVSSQRLKNEAIRAKKRLLKKLSTSNVITTMEDKKNYLNYFQETYNLTPEKLEEYSHKILKESFEKKRFPDDRKMFLVLHIPKEYNRPIKKYISDPIATDLTRLDKSISESVEITTMGIISSLKTERRTNFSLAEAVFEFGAKTILDAKIAIASLDQVTRMGKNARISARTLSFDELKELDKLTVPLFKALEKEPMTPMDIMFELEIGCIKVYRLLGFYNFLKSDEQISVDETLAEELVRRYMKSLVENDNGEWLVNPTISNLISERGFTALESKIIVDYISQVHSKAQEVNLEEIEEERSIQIQEDFFELMRVCEKKHLAVGIPANVVYCNVSLKEAFICERLTNKILEEFEGQEEKIKLPSFTFSEKKINLRLFESDESKIAEGEVSISPSCVVSGEPIDFEKDIVKRCPECGSLAKLGPLSEWLRVNHNTCLVCGSIFRLEEYEDV
ncbi:MAG: hypothetical protein GF308_00150 [Candidatus Heimdallarchaeota archaeon]|nr:hypothetical protein [Candidatus Heimdallarchaeota archaeon]